MKKPPQHTDDLTEKPPECEPSNKTPKRVTLPEFDVDGGKLCKNLKGTPHYRRISDFTKNRSKKHGLEPYCKSCDSKRKKEFYRKKRLKKKRELTTKFKSSIVGTVTTSTASEFGEIIGSALKEVLENGKA